VWQDGARIGRRIWCKKEGEIRMCGRDLTLSPGRGLGPALPVHLLIKMQKAGNGEYKEKEWGEARRDW
jgi:hypothetical protein